MKKNYQNSKNKCLFTKEIIQKQHSPIFAEVHEISLWWRFTDPLPVGGSSPGEGAVAAPTGWPAHCGPGRTGGWRPRSAAGSSPCSVIRQCAAAGRSAPPQGCNRRENILEIGPRFFCCRFIKNPNRNTPPLTWNSGNISPLLSLSLSFFSLCSRPVLSISVQHRRRDWTTSMTTKNIVRYPSNYSCSQESLYTVQHRRKTGLKEDNRENLRCDYHFRGWLLN